MCDKITTEFFTLRRMKQYSVWRVPNSAAFYNPTVGVRILNNGIGKSLSNVGVELIPSYCYGRLYTKGDVLKEHTDRKASEYAVSVTTVRVVMENGLYGLKIMKIINFLMR